MKKTSVIIGLLSIALIGAIDLAFHFWKKWTHLKCACIGLKDAVKTYLDPAYETMRDAYIEKSNYEIALNEGKSAIACMEGVIEYVVSCAKNE